jgi:hypothetical protein
MSTDATPPDDNTRRAVRRPGRRTAIGAAATGLVLGGVASGYMVTHAATASTKPSVVTTASTVAAAATPTPSTTTPATGTFHSNEGAAHEAGESAAREAQEKAGVFPGGAGGAFHPNESAAHETGESAAREAQENAGQRPTVP